MHALLWLAVSVFGLKVFWNLGVPFALFLNSGAGRGRRVSLMPAIEILLLILITILSALSPGSGWMEHPRNPALWGTLLIAGSYLHLFLAGMLLGWLVRRDRRPGGSSSRSSAR